MVEIEYLLKENLKSYKKRDVSPKIAFDRRIIF